MRLAENDSRLVGMKVEALVELCPKRSRVVFIKLRHYKQSAVISASSAITSVSFIPEKPETYIHDIRIILGFTIAFYFIKSMIQSKSIPG